MYNIEHRLIIYMASARTGVPHHRFMEFAAVGILPKTTAP